MSTIELSSEVDEQAFSQAEMLQDLDAGAPLTCVDYQQQMDAMFGELKANQGMDIWAARTEVWDRYITHGPQGPINTFSQVMLRAGYDDYYSGVIKQCDEKKKHLERWSTQELDDSDAAKLDAKTFLVESNHVLRDLLEEQGSNFTKTQFVDWYARAYGDKAKTAAERAMGAASEIAAKAAMEATGAFREGTVQYGDVEQDLAGMDIVGQLKKGGEWIGVDAKAGEQMPVHSRKSYGIQLTIGAPTQRFDEHYCMDNRGIAGLAGLINLELNKIKHSSSHHASRQGSGR